MSDTKFKVGDKVRVLRRTSGYTGRFAIGQFGIIQRFQGDGSEYVVLTGDRDYSDSGTCWHYAKNLELVEDKSKWHKHHDLIIAWAKGAEIQANLGGWWGKTNPEWNEYTEYRVKPTAPKSDKERIAELEARVEELENKNGG